ncbi:MAG TPA: pur operon repressor [Candidatus Avacidaminococcus intestinavium]|uniref:Pur operon repressor n=1 Tax=Candidatus Avacidaminococcus intestinavium TaxID=2840684 RepID=A0A9D1SM30_9FIRM|nr:pur operon repressor [Candidatus Avacidaminococcus intestinavium]
MGRIKRIERVAALTKELVDNPLKLYSFTDFCKRFDVAKSTLSEDVQAIKNGLVAYDLGTIETMAGAAGGVRFIPYHSRIADTEFLQDLAVRMAEPERILPGGMIYMNDLVLTPRILMRLGEILMNHGQNEAPDYIMTVETKGIPLALFVARAYNVPLVMARRESRITEGSAVSINYVSGSTKRIQTMSLPKRALPKGAKVLIVDDFMKAGGTAKGLMDLVGEVGAEVVGVSVLVATKEPIKKMVAEYFSLFVLNDIDDVTKSIDIQSNF